MHCFAFCIDSIVKNYWDLISAIEVAKQRHDDHASPVYSLLTKMESCRVFLYSYIVLYSSKVASRMLHAVAEQFSIKLHGKDKTVSEETEGEFTLYQQRTTYRLLFCTSIF